MKEAPANLGALFEKLQSWFESQCDGEWEHGDGISIATLDNPGWDVKINLVDTEWEEVVIEPYGYGDSEDGDDWLYYNIVDRKFEGTSSIRNLNRILTAFFDIIEKPKI